MKGTFNILTSIAFLAMLLVPLLQMLSSPIGDISETEQRTLAQPPEFDRNLEHFVEDSEAFLNDHFGFREELIEWNNVLRVRYFSRSPVEDVVIGKNDWLYLNTNDLMNDHRGLVGLAASGIDDLNNYFGQRSTWLAERDIAYLVVFAPDKQSIYPEFLPPAYRNVVTPNNTRLDNFMASPPTVNVLDLRAVLLGAKSEGLLYAKYDTHWNQQGAYLAYVAIMEKLRADFPQLAALSLDSLRFGEYERTGDLARLMSMENEMIEVLPRVAIPRRDRCAQQVESNITRCDGQPLRVLMFHDSFGERLQHYMSESFGEIMYVQERFMPTEHQSLIDSFQPDLVIDESVERWLSNFDSRTDR